MLVARPAPIVAFAAPRLATAGTPMLGRVPGIEREGGAVLGAEPAVHGQQRFLFRNDGHPRQQRPRSLSQVGEQRREIGRATDLLRALGERFRGHHARTPSVAQVSGSTLAPPAATVLAASRSSPRMTKNMRSEEHTSELQSRLHLVCRLLLEKKKKNKKTKRKN